MAIRDLNNEKGWKAKFEDYKTSGLSIKSWCKKQGIKSTTFHYWIKKFSSPEKVETEFAKIVKEPSLTNNEDIKTYESKENILKDVVTKQIPIQSSDFQVYFNNIRLIIPSDFNPIALAGLIKILQTL